VPSAKKTGSAGFGNDADQFFVAESPKNLIQIKLA